ncbi:MAG: hypothetical protein M1828_001054 [Chrysothrix sp. TS-e1954]|nr:MAG: hypothetical protein M1828_001054 [Chrysothrix sp. TS-e1954]
MATGSIHPLPSHFLLGDDDKDSDYMSKVLNDLQTIAEHKPCLFRKTAYTLRVKGQYEKARFDRLLNYKGPEINTKTLLRERSNEWMRNPMSFWELQSGSDAPMLDPQAQIVGRYAHAMRIDASKIKTVSIEGPATTYHELGKTSTLEEARTILRTMIDAGHRYKNLEIQVGVGAPLVLGCELAETHWTKVLPKSTPKSLQAFQALRNSEIPHLAQKYQKLRMHIVGELLHRLESAESPRNGIVMPAGPPETTSMDELRNETVNRNIWAPGSSDVCFSTGEECEEVNEFDNFIT